mgnify:CR=1 FL=1
MNILVVGGAGYIGSHMVKLLCEKNVGVTTLDNLSSGYRDAVIGGHFIEGDFGDIDLLNKVFSDKNFDAVMHFASSIQVGESVVNPAKYYRNNVANTQNLLDVMLEHKVQAFVFSSTAAIFGEPQQSLIDEEHPKNPINPYGRSKYMVEQMLQDYGNAYGLRYACLRYFNAAGADPDGVLGERHEPETHLIPLVLQAASGRREGISVFGSDYPTPDGSCIRDYIHINDLADAHWLALKQLMEGGNSLECNLGNGSGYSVFKVIEMAKKVSGQKIDIHYEERRQGDPAILVADSQKAKEKLGWSPKIPDLKTIVEHAWQWEQKHSDWAEGKSV